MIKFLSDVRQSLSVNRPECPLFVHASTSKSWKQQHSSRGMQRDHHRVACLCWSVARRCTTRFLSTQTLNMPRNSLGRITGYVPTCPGYDKALQSTLRNIGQQNTQHYCKPERMFQWWSSVRLCRRSSRWLGAHCLEDLSGVRRTTSSATTSRYAT